MYITRPQASGERVSAGLSPTALTASVRPRRRGRRRRTRRSYAGAPKPHRDVCDSRLFTVTFCVVRFASLNPAFPGVTSSGPPARARSRGHAGPLPRTSTVDAHTDRSKMGVVKSTRPPSQWLPHSEHEALPARRRGKPKSYSSAFNCCSCVLPWLIAAVAHSCRGS